MSRSLESTSFTTRLSMAMLPAVMSSRPASIRSIVDFPQPDGPTRTMNSPSAMSSEMPCRTGVAPNDFVICEKDTEAIRISPLGFNCAAGQPGHHVTPECVVDRCRGQRVDEARGHQELPRRVVRRNEVAECDCQRDRLLVRQQ